MHLWNSGRGERSAKARERTQEGLSLQGPREDAAATGRRSSSLSFTLLEDCCRKKDSGERRSSKRKDARDTMLPGWAFLPVKPLWIVDRVSLQFSWWEKGLRKGGRENIFVYRNRQKTRTGQTNLTAITDSATLLCFCHSLPVKDHAIPEKGGRSSRRMTIQPRASCRARERTHDSSQESAREKEQKTTKKKRNGESRDIGLMNRGKEGEGENLAENVPQKNTSSSFMSWRKGH